MNFLQSNNDTDLQAPTESRVRIRRIGLAWAAVVVWAGIVWALGGDAFSATRTNSTIVQIFQALFGDLDMHTRYRILMGVRKSAHFIEYAILAILTFRAALISASRNRWTSATWVAIFIVATLATADEARQTFSSTRTGSPYDVLLDISAGAIAIIGLLVISQRMREGTQTA